MMKSPFKSATLCHPQILPYSFRWVIVCLRYVEGRLKQARSVERWDSVHLSALRERQKVGGQAALRSGSCVCGCGLNFRYQRRNRSSRSSLRTLVLVSSKRWAPRSVHCISCFLTNRLLTTWLIVDSTNAVLIVSPCRRRSPKFGMNSRLLQM
jgi:hypothetical protein